MASISLKMTPKEASREGYGTPAQAKPPEYPWGTVLTLTDEQVRQLWPKSLPQAKQALKLDVAAFVKGITVNQQAGDKQSTVSIDLQLTDIATETDDDKDLAGALYGKDGPRQSKD